MSTDRSAAQDLAGEGRPSSSEGLRQDTRTSNSEMCDATSHRSSTQRQTVCSNDGVGHYPKTPLCTLLMSLLLHFSSQISSMQIPGINLRIQQLELETAQPERREAARARKKLTKEVQRNLSDSSKNEADKIKYLETVFSDQVKAMPAATACPHCKRLIDCCWNRSHSRPGLRIRSSP